MSQVLLRRFQEPDPENAVDKVDSFFLEAPGLPPVHKDVRECGRSPQFKFVPFTAPSVEQRWRIVEDLLPETLDAVGDGAGLIDPIHAQRLRELIVLHLIRSIESDINHWRLWEPMHKAARQVCASEPSARRASLVGLAAETLRMMDTGAYFRAMIEVCFDRIRAFAESLDIEILIPKQGEFIIGDIPALPMMGRYIRSCARNEAGMLSADCIVLPLGPTSMAKLGGISGATAVPIGTVDLLNEAQVKAAFSHVFFRTGSGLRGFVEAVRRSRPSEGPLRDAYKERVFLSAEGKPQRPTRNCQRPPFPPRRAGDGPSLVPGVVSASLNA